MTGRPPSERRPAEGKRHVWDDPANVRRLIRWFLASCVVVALVDLVVHRHSPFEHGELPLEGTWFFYCWYGFVACVILVVAAKQMRRVVMRDEEYYDSHDDLQPAVSSLDLPEGEEDERA